MSSLKKIGLLLCLLGLLSACGDEASPPKVVPKTVQAPPPPNVMETIKTRGKLLVGVKREQTMLNTLGKSQSEEGPVELLNQGRKAKHAFDQREDANRFLCQKPILAKPQALLESL